MDPLKLFYELLIHAAGPMAAAVMSAKGRFGGRWAERLGFLTVPAPLPGKPRLLFHAASVGEAKSAAAVIEAALNLAEPEKLPEIYLSVGTPAGIEAAEKTLKDQRRVWVLAAPVDFWGAPGRYLDALQPCALIIMETELWPNLIEGAHRRGVKLMLAAARLGDRSFRRYKRIPGFMGKLLRRFDHIAAMGERERGLYAALGAPQERLTISGNPKFDPLLREVQSPAFHARTEAWREKIRGHGPLIVAGSTHPGEEEIIAKAFESISGCYPDATLLVAPRHLNRVPEVADFFRGRNLPVTLTSQASFPAKGVLLADQMGQLINFYAASDVVIVGGSLVQGLTGHNPLEAAAAKSPMLFGPYMESFALEAKDLLNAGGAKQSAPDRLAADIAEWLDNPGAAQKSARAAHHYLSARGLAAPTLAAAIFNLIHNEEAHA